jgi:fatty acid synthase, animal type
MATMTFNALVALKETNIRILFTEKNPLLTNCIGDEEFIKIASNVLTENKYILSRESKEFLDLTSPNMQLISVLPTTDGEFLHLLQFKSNSYIFEPQAVIEITSDIQHWLDPLKASLKKGSTILYSYNTDKPSGILGFINCIRREFPVDKLKCFFINDSTAPPFDIDDIFYKNQLNLNHAINVFKDGTWGSYRYIDMLPELDHPISQMNHCFVNCLVKGDLSTLTWLNGPLDITDEKLDIITIQFSSLNFKDAMLALERIPDNVYDRVGKQCVLGLEFSGIKRDGKRVMGIGSNAGALATHYDAKHTILWEVPEFWSLEEAATVSLVYFTVYFAYFITTKIEQGKSILIHSGSGGIG